MSAQAMRSPKDSGKVETREISRADDAGGNQANDETDEIETEPDPNEYELDESNLTDTDDDRWDVFILDDDSDPLPDYGDFWFPD
jgi:hypothetical protein